MKNLILIFTVFLFTSQLHAQADSSQFYFKKGMDEKAARRYLVASSYFDKAIKFNPSFADAYIENGRVNLEMRKVDAAQGLFLKANQLQPDNATAIKELTSLYFNNRQFQKAIDMAQKCKTCADGDRIIAISYYNLEDYGKAVAGLTKVLVKNPNDAEAAYTLGRSYLEQEDYKNAIPAYQRAVALDPSKNVWMYELGLQYYNNGDFKNALTYFTMADKAGYLKSNDFYENIGFAYLNTGDITNGMSNLKIVLDRKPNNKELLQDIAQAMYTSKHYDDALNYYQKLLELDPKDASALYMAGMAFQKKGQKEKGQQMCDKAINMDPSLAKNRQKRGENIGL